MASPLQYEPFDPAVDTLIGRIEGFSLGGSFVLHSRTSGALLCSNEFGRDIYQGLSAHLEVPEIAEQISRHHNIARAEAALLVAEILQRWQAAGLFQDDMCPFAEPVAYRAPETDALSLYNLGNRYVVLRCENAQISDQIAVSLQDYIAKPRQLPERCETSLIDVIADGDGYGVFRDRQAIWGRAPHDLTRFHILRETMDHLCTPARVAAHLHAAAVTEQGRAVILAGESGQGKTTLAMGLVAAGGQLAADDHVALSVDGRNMLAFPVASAVKRGAWGLPQVQALGLTPAAIPAATAASPQEGVCYLRAPRSVSAATPLQIAAVVFPNYAGPEADNSLTLIDPAEALTRLIQTGGRVSRHNASLAPLVDLLSQVPCCNLRYGSTRYSIETCQTLLAQ